jgi:hypothetical protein
MQTRTSSTSGTHGQQMGGQTQQHGGTHGTTQGGIPHEKIAMRAYEKWCKRGRPHGTDKQDWQEAEAELRAEASRGSSSPPSMGGRR